MSDPFADWDAAYVLGALSSAERRAYEEHVDDCARCAAAVAELGMMPGLLRLVPDAEGAALLEPAPEPRPDGPAAVPGAARHRPLRRRARVLAAAAAVVTLAGLGGGVLVADRADRAAPPSVAGTGSVELTAVTASPLRATVALSATSWGTRVTMTCTYAGDYGPRRSYGLYVVDAAGHRQLVSRWRAGPGDVAHTSGSTDLAPAAVDRVELRADDGTLLLARDL